MQPHTQTRQNERTQPPSPEAVLAALSAAIDAEVAAHAARTAAGRPAIRLALAAAVERAIDLMDALDAATEDLEEDPDLEDGADHEDIDDDREAVDEDGDPLDLGEVDGWRRPRRARVSRTEWPIHMAERELRRAIVISAVATSGNVVRFPGGNSHG